MRTGSRRVSRLASVTVFGLGSLLAGSSLVWGAEVSDLVQAAGLQAIEPPRPATDFELSGLDGGQRALSDFAGRWVILTFWASWCGPCRAEMPSLESLHRSHGDRGVVVLGVSVDEQRQAAEGFVAQYGLTFPQLWDDESRVGRQYRASAIPMSYLVDPRGRLVALARGSRDWTQLAGLFEELLTAVPVEPGADAQYAEAVELPAVLNPPSAEIEVSDRAPRAGEPFTLEVRLRWAGTAEEYLPQPPRVQLPDGVVQQRVTASSSTRDGAQVVLYRIVLQADEPGSYALDPVELRYRPRFAADETMTRMQGPTVSVVPRTVFGMRPQNLALASAGVAVSAAAALLVARRWRSRRASGAGDGTDAALQLGERYRQVRNLRLQGDLRGFALGLLELLDDLQEEDRSRDDALTALGDSLRYGNRLPPASDLDRWQREVERRLAATRADPDAVARESLRLKTDEEKT